MNWRDSAKKTTRINQEMGYMWIGFSPQANGSRWGDAEFDEFIGMHVGMYEKEGWALVEYSVSLSEERVNLRFKDTRRRKFKCVLNGEFLGKIDADKLARLLASVGIECKIEQFELCNNEC
jgi:hypothetical protein